MRITRQIALSFIIPFGIALLCLVGALIALQGKQDCREICRMYEACADPATLMIVDLFGYPGYGSFLLALILPVLIVVRSRPGVANHIFERDSSN